MLTDEQLLSIYEVALHIACNGDLVKMAECVSTAREQLNLDLPDD